MNKIINLLVILHISFGLNGQVTDVLTNLNDPNELILVGNEIYFTEILDVSTGNSRIAKFNINDPTNTLTTVVGGLGGASSLALYGNELYIAERYVNKISKIDIIETNPTIIDVVTDIESPRSLIIRNSELYIAERFGKIKKIDLSNTPYTVITLFETSDDFYPYSMVFDNNLLYVSDRQINGYVWSFNLNDETFQRELVARVPVPKGIAFKGEELYICDRTGIRTANFDFYSDTTQIIFDLYDPESLVFSNYELYIAQNSKISKVNIQTLGVNDFNKDNIRLYPNPSKEYLKIVNLEKVESYRIFDILGNEIKKGKTSNQGKIDIHNLNNGIYFLKINLLATIKFIKE